MRRAVSPVAMWRRATAPNGGQRLAAEPQRVDGEQVAVRQLGVAWRSTARSRSSGVMPSPSSTTRMRLRPPPSITTSIRLAPASKAFSTSSFTAEAGRSTTSPAAMRSTSTGSRRRTAMIKETPGEPGLRW